MYLLYAESWMSCTGLGRGAFNSPYNFGNARFFVPNNRSSSRSKVAACILIRYKDERKDGQFRSDAVYALYG